MEPPKMLIITSACQKFVSGTVTLLQKGVRDLGSVCLFVLSYSRLGFYLMVQYGCYSSCHHCHIPANRKTKRLGKPFSWGALFWTLTEAKIWILFYFWIYYLLSLWLVGKLVHLILASVFSARKSKWWKDKGNNEHTMWDGNVLNFSLQ